MSLRKRGRSWQVRVAPFPAKSFPTYEAANAYDLELRLRRAQGDRYVEKGRTLGKEIDAWLIRNQAMASPRTATTRYNDRSSKIWAPFRAVELSALRRAPIEDFVAQRAAAHPRSAKNELEFLKKVLKDAQGRGHRIDERVLGIPPIKHAARRGRALTVEQLYELASWVPEHSKLANGRSTRASTSICSGTRRARSWRWRGWIRPWPPSARVTRTGARCSSSDTGTCTSRRSASRRGSWKR